MANGNGKEQSANFQTTIVRFDLRYGHVSQITTISDGDETKFCRNLGISRGVKVNLFHGHDRTLITCFDQDVIVKDPKGTILRHLDTPSDLPVIGREGELHTYIVERQKVQILDHKGRLAYQINHEPKPPTPRARQ